MSTPKERILARLRAAREAESPAGEAHGDAPGQDTREAVSQWMAHQAPLGNLVERFAAGQAAVGGEVRRVPGWDALGMTVVPWLAEHEVRTVITGTEPRLEPLREALATDGRFELGRYDRPAHGAEGEAMRGQVFAADCGITTSWGGIAETGSVVIVPTPAEPRLLSLAVPVHLAVVEASALWPTLGDFMDSGRYQAEAPTNLVFVTGASRTADIEMTLALGVHGPKIFLVALVE